MQTEEWIRKIAQVYRRKKVDLPSRSSNAPHRRIEGQFGSSRTVKGYEHIIVYLQLSERIDFEKVKYFLKYRLLQWVKNNWDYHEKLDIFFFIDNIVKGASPGDIRIVQELYPQTSLYTKYRDGQHPNSRDLLIFISDNEGFEVDEKLKESLNRKLGRIIWVKLEKENDVFIETRKIPFLDNNFEEIKNEINEEGINNTDNANTSSKKYLDKSDFYLFFSNNDIWETISAKKPIEISGNILTIADNHRIFRDMGETYFIPTDRIIELKNKLNKLNIFQMENKYPSTSIDGIYWQLMVSFDGNQVGSNGHNNYPPNWSQIVKAIEDCVKYKRKINIKEKKMNKKIDKINEKVWEAINSTINKFREHPYYFFTESDIVSYFYHRLYSTNHEQVTQDGKRIYLIHREYPTNFRYKKTEMLNNNFTKPYLLTEKKGDRGNYDLAILDPIFINNANSEEDIVNKNVKLLEIRTENNRHFKNSKELLFAFEFKYIINNSKNFVNQVKMDNKKLLFAKEYGGAEEAINLVFCNTNYHYIDDLKKEVSNTNKKILSIFIQSYFDGKKKYTPRPLMNKQEPRIK
jgi:hypothetical protein